MKFKCSLVLLCLALSPVILNSNIYAQDLFEPDPGYALRTRATKKTDFLLFPLSACTGSAEAAVSFTNTKVYVLSHPAGGASFNKNLYEMASGGRTLAPIQENMRTFIYVIGGSAVLNIAGEGVVELSKDDALYIPAQATYTIENKASEDFKFIAIKKSPNQDIESKFFKTKLSEINPVPVGNDTGFLLRFLGNDSDFLIIHITVMPGSGNAFMESHIEQHGIFFLSGNGGYYMIKDEKYDIFPEDYIFMDSYVPHGFRSVTEPVSFLLLKIYPEE
ncbi:MAG: cupin domain-containing protein [Candidatus Omnitrophota bacterium]